MIAAMLMAVSVVGTACAGAGDDKGNSGTSVGAAASESTTAESGSVQETTEQEETQRAELAAILEKLEKGEEVTELPADLTLDELLQINSKDYYGPVRIAMDGIKATDQEEEPIDYLVFDGYKITREYWDNVTISQFIADLYNNVEWGELEQLRNKYADDEVDWSDAEAISRYFHEMIENDGKIDGWQMWFHLDSMPEDADSPAGLIVSVTTENADRIGGNGIVVDYTHTGYSEVGSNIPYYCCYDRKQNGKYYIMGKSFTYVLKRYDWSWDDL